jgi:hypothetical protein
LHSSECVRHVRILLTRIVNDYRNEKSNAIGHQVRALDRQPPLQPEITLETRLGIGRDDRQEQHTVLDLLSDLPIPSVATAQFALVEPNLDAGRPKRRTNAPSSLRILRSVAQEYCARWLRHRCFFSLQAMAIA